jgi:hypothetical protein
MYERVCDWNAREGLHFARGECHGIQVDAEDTQM